MAYPVASENLELHPPFCRARELAEILLALKDEECHAVFLSAEMGLGASTVLRAVQEASKDKVPVIYLHATAARKKVPFGVFSVLVGDLPPVEMTSRVELLRRVLIEIESRRPPAGSGECETESAILLIDDAHFMDSDSALVVRSLVYSGKVKVVASHHPHEPLPTTLGSIWANGMAEIVEMQALTQEQGHNFCVSTLDGPVLDASSRQLWNFAGGNPLLMTLMIRDARAAGQIQLKRGIWILTQGLRLRSQSLVEKVSQQIKGLSEEASEALYLIAFSEPIEQAGVIELLGAECVQELFERNLLKEIDSEQKLLRLINAVCRDIVRGLVPPSQRRLLHARLPSRFHDDATTPESLVRRVLWAIESGIEVPAEKLLNAAMEACQVYQTPVALRLLDAVQDPEFNQRAMTIRGRANFNLGRYQDAGNLLQEAVQLAQTVDQRLFPTLLLASVRSAMGDPVDAILSDAMSIREDGIRLAQKPGTDLGRVLSLTQARAVVLQLQVYSLTGDYLQMEPLVRQVTKQAAESSKEPSLQHNLAIALAIDSEKLTVMGKPDQASRRVAEAFALSHDSHHDVYFLPEMIVFRSLSAALCSGRWQEAREVLGLFSVSGSGVMHSFGGSRAMTAGVILLRQGKPVAALEELVSGLEALRLSDPQQLAGCCRAMAFYAAATTGHKAIAESLVRGLKTCRGSYLNSIQENVYTAAGWEVLKQDGEGIAHLLEQADVAAEKKHRFLELLALTLAYEVGEVSMLPRIARVAGHVEGDWARAWQLFASEMNGIVGSAPKAIAQQLADFGMESLAQAVLTRAVDSYPGQDAAQTPKQVSITHHSLPAEKSSLPTEATPLNASLAEANAALTKREREVSKLAAAGLSDRAIADTLFLSIRTVEGHLHRSYVKFGVNGREELAALFVGVTA